MIGDIIGGIGNIIGGFLGRSSQEKMMEQQIALQREFAQSGIQWRVADARAAGVHPLYALGAQTHSFSPMSIGSDPLASGIAAAGQNIGRAIDSTASQGSREKSFQAAIQALQLQRGKLENDLLKTQIASNVGRLNSAQIGPPMPSGGSAGSSSYLIPGQTQSGLIKPKPLEVSPAPPGAPQQEGGAITDVGFARTATGFVPVPSADVKERIEDNLPHELMHFLRNNVLPERIGGSSRPPFPAPAGKQWIWTGIEYQLRDAAPPHRPRDDTWWRRGVFR